MDRPRPDRSRRRASFSRDSVIAHAPSDIAARPRGRLIHKIHSQDTCCVTQTALMVVTPRPGAETPAVGEERRTLLAAKRAHLANLPVDRYPHVRAAAAPLTECDDEPAYCSFGVDLYIEGAPALMVKLKRTPQGEAEVQARDRRTPKLDRSIIVSASTRSVPILAAMLRSRQWWTYPPLRTTPAGSMLPRSSPATPSGCSRTNTCSRPWAYPAARTADTPLAWACATPPTDGAWCTHAVTDRAARLRHWQPAGS